MEFLFSPTSTEGKGEKLFNRSNRPTWITCDRERVDFLCLTLSHTKVHRFHESIIERINITETQLHTRPALAVGMHQFWIPVSCKPFSHNKTSSAFISHWENPLLQVEKSLQKKQKPSWFLRIRLHGTKNFANFLINLKIIIIINYKY